MHLNSVQLIDRVGKNGPKLSYASSGSPSTTFTLEVDEVSKAGETFTLFLPCELWGQAELAAETLEAGDEVMLTGRLKYKSVLDAKTGAKVSKVIVSSWGISQRQPAATSRDTVDDSASSAPEINHGHSGAPEPGPGPKARKRAVPKHLQREWQPADRN